jgi:hypothetical protein
MAEIKPNSPTGGNKLDDQIANWGLKPGDVLPITYDHSGFFYYGFTR